MQLRLNYLAWKPSVTPGGNLARSLQWSVVVAASCSGDVPLVVWGPCFGKVGGVISFLFGPVWGYHRMGPQCLLDPSCLSLQYLCCSSLCVGGIWSVCYIWSISPVLSGVLCKSMLSQILFLSLSRRTWALGPCLSPRIMTTWHDDSLLSPFHLAVLLLQFQLFCLRLWNPDLFTGRATCPRPAVFNSLETAGAV